MKPLAKINALIPPATVVVAGVLVLVTVLASEPGSTESTRTVRHGTETGEADRTATAQVRLKEPAAPDKQLVPVRRETTASPPEPGDAVALRSLVIAAKDDASVRATWEEILQSIGAPYDIVIADEDDVDLDDLVRPDGVGRYNAIFLTSSGLLAEQDDGTYSSTLTRSEWEALREYERTYGVRQVSLSTAPGEYPEDYCLRPDTEGMADDDSVVTMTSEGREIFDYLRPDAEIPLGRSYVYYAELADDCDATALLTHGEHVLAVVAPTDDGRERLGLSLTLAPEELSTSLLGYGLVRWATKGVFVGEQRHWINVDIDDWFATTTRHHADGSEGMIRLTGPEVAEISRQQDHLRTEHPLAAEFVLNLPYNAGRFDTSAPARCSTENTSDTLSSFSKCLADKFRWVNHTMNHPEMNTTGYEESYAEIVTNLGAAAEGGLTVPSTVLKTPEYSGLGVYSDDRTAAADVVDHGLEGSNADMLRAASKAGVKYVHGNMSFDSHRPKCFNCGIYHPLQPDLLLVPDWPVNVAYEAATPEEQTRLYNQLYGENATEEWSLGRDIDYREFVDLESDLALSHVASGSAYTHTLHQGNLHIYEPGKSLTFDWLDAVLDKYESYYAVPLKTPDWATLAKYVEARTAHFAELAKGEDPVWNRVTDEVAYTAGSTGSLFITGLETRPATSADQTGPDEAELYGTDRVSRVGLAAGEAVTLGARPRR